ncbi:tRNA (adenosine(37)-N6)-dimethylallyltransferase MiaA [Oleidesulfovibrio sp.]|uniref:tRNA (adenosine(37)-N6)-dimethylallyltransferase MiaA n=1 Tax=Oleidesulfovibrio sp. TaxID=2909707 RepID=UPI003A83ED7D
MSGISPVPLVCLVGPTGAGKTAASLFLAEKFNGAVVNCDSRQVYKDFPIITAQPSAEEQSKCPHHLYGFLDTRDKMSAGVFLDMASQAISAIHASGKLPLLVGGTGMYLKALLEGIANIPDVPEEISLKWQQLCRQKGAAALHGVLKGIDPQSATRLHPNDSQRIVRALEVHEATGKTLSWWHEQPLPASPYRAVKIAIKTTLDELTPLLAKRIEIMLAQGAIAEAKAALAICSDKTAPGWSGIGCAEIYSYLKGEIDLTECKRVWLTNTRQYAKRQLTWFRRVENLHWLNTHDLVAMDELVETHLATGI